MEEAKVCFQSASQHRCGVAKWWERKRRITKREQHCRVDVCPPWSLPLTAAKEAQAKVQEQGKWHIPKCSSSICVCSSGASAPEDVNDEENPRWEIRAQKSLLKAKNLQKHAG